MKFLCSVTLIVLLAHSLQGQELYGKYLGLEQGLLTEECYDINYDEKGYLIVGTEYGPMKFNGEKFIAICTNLSMERRVIYDFEKDTQGNIYLLNSKNELFRLQNDKAVLIPIKNSSQFHIRESIFIKIYAAKDGIYISSLREHLKFSFKTRKIHRLYPDSDSGFIFIYNPKKKFPFIKYVPEDSPVDLVTFKFPENKQQFQFNNTMVFDSREDYLKVKKTTYVLMCMKLFRNNGKKLIPLEFGRILFMEYFHDRIWLCTYDGLLELDTKGHLIQQHFKGELIGGVVPLKSGGIAVSLNRKGVFVSANITNRIHTNFRPSATASFKGMNLVGCSDGQVFRYVDHKFEKFLNAPPKIPTQHIEKTFDKQISNISTFKNSLLITYNQGILFFSNDFKKIKDFRNFHYSIFGEFSYKENIFFIERNGLVRNNWKSFHTLSFPYDYQAFPINNIRCYSYLNDSTMILGTKTGLVRFNLKTYSYSRPDIFKKELSIAGIYVIGAEKLLVFTRYEGIYIVYKNKIIQKISPPCISISSALFYNNVLIVRGNDGIYIKPITQSINDAWVKTFSGKADNLFILDKSLLIALKNDLITKKMSDYQLIYKPEIALNKFQLGRFKMNVFPRSIPPNKSISVDIDVLQFDANKLGLYYILKGENTISQQVEGTKINFDALKSGEYELKIHPVIDGKIQFNNSKTFRFTMEETFWESTAFFIILGVLLLSIIFSIFLIVNLRRKRRIAERAALESKLNEYKLLAVKAQVNPHFLSNGLAAIQALILKGNNDLAAQYLAKFSFLMRKILYYSETQFISVNQELQLIDAYLELELLRFRNRFNIQKEIHLSEQELNEFQFPSLLLQPILENAIWHGLKFQENNPELHISFKINGNQELLVEISDNGPGFSSSDKSEEHLSKGNQLITDRIDSLNEQFQSKVADIKISSSDSGTTVAFVFAPQLYQSKMS